MKPTTLQQHWDSATPGDSASPHRWQHPFLGSKIAVLVRGISLCPHRIATDGKVFRLDSYLRDGRPLRLIVAPDYPCQPVNGVIPLPPDGTAERLGFAPRNRDRAVTDVDRLTLDLTA